MLISQNSARLLGDFEIVRHLESLIFRQEIDKTFRVKKRNRYIFQLFSKLSTLSDLEQIILYLSKTLLNLRQTKTLIAILEKLAKEAYRLMVRNSILAGLSQDSPYQAYLQKWHQKLTLSKEALISSRKNSDTRIVSLRKNASATLYLIGQG